MSAERMQFEVDTAKAEAFAGRFLTTLNDGALCLMVSVGHRTGPFDVMSQSPPATSEELAARAGLNERYVPNGHDSYGRCRGGAVHRHGA